MRKTLMPVVVTAALMLLPAVAHATTITRTYSFDATFSAGPITDISGSFTATFDPDATGGTLDAFHSNLPADYLPVGFGNDFGLISVGNDCSVFGCAGTPMTDTFDIGFGVLESGDIFFPQSAEYYTTASQFPYFPDSFTVASVPLPAPVWLLGSALLGLGMLGRGGYVRRNPSASAARTAI
jgi:hypothetical protein